MGTATGLFNAENGNPVELNQRSFAATVLRTFPNGSAPMFALASQGGRSRAKATTHGYFSKTMSFQRLKSDGAEANTAATTLTMDSTAGVIPGMVFYNLRSRENVRVMEVPSGTTVNVLRGFGRVAAAAIQNDDNWINVGFAAEQGSNRPIARRLTTTHIPNYTQIFRNAWALTDTARASYAEAGISNIAENRKDCMMFHSTDIESAIVWGQAKMDTTGPSPLHSTQGILDALYQYAPTNVNPASSTTNYAQLVTLVEPAFTTSTDMSDPTTRVMFCDNLAAKVITDIGRKSGQVNIMQRETSFGMKFTSFQFYLGTINMLIHPLFNGLQTQGFALIVDLAALKLAYMDGRDTKKEEYGNGSNQQNGQDAVGGSLTTELAVELINPFACAAITGLTAGIAET